MSLLTPFSPRILKLSIQCGKLAARTLKTSASLWDATSLIQSPNAKLSKTVIDKYLCLPLPECMCTVEYVWIDGSGENIRSKGKTLEYIPDNHKEVPTWGFTGGAAMMEVPKEANVMLVPVAMYNDPFRRNHNKMVMCDVYDDSGKPLPANNRHTLAESMNKVCDQEIMWGLEQQYMILDVDNRPYGWPTALGEPRREPIYYCGVGADRAFAREIAECHYRACLYSGVKVASINADYTVAQWKFQTGITPGMKGADDLWMARYILGRIGEEYGVNISYHPKLIDDIPGSGLNINFSTKTTRQDNGLSTLEEYMNKLCKRHEEHMKNYDPKGGALSKLRLTGKYGTSEFDKFTCGVGAKDLSVRITKESQTKKKGYVEDRRPAANADPYKVCDLIIRTCLLGEC